MTSIAIEPARQPEVERLLRLGEEFMLSHYPPESCYLLNVGELERPEVTVFVARVDGAALGMVALVSRDDGSAELKRMFVDAAARGQGLADGLLPLRPKRLCVRRFLRQFVEARIKRAPRLMFFPKAPCATR